MREIEKLFEDFNDFYSFGFGRPENLKFNAGRTKDMNPAYWETITDDDGNRIGFKSTCRTVGLAPEDVKVTLEENKIVIQGSTEFDGNKYDTHFEIRVSESVIGDIESIKYKTLNGLTYVYIYTKKPEYTKINIEKF